MRSSLLGGLAIVTTLLFAGCGLLSSSQQDESIGWSAQRLYGAKDAMNEGMAEGHQVLESWKRATPWPLRQQAQLEVAYAQYKTAGALGDRRRGSLHQAVSESSQRRLRLLLKGLINFNELQAGRLVLTPRNTTETRGLREALSVRRW